MHVKCVRCHVVLASLPFDSLQVIHLVTGDKRCVSSVFDVTLSLPSFLCGVLLRDDLPHGCKVFDFVSSLFFDWVYAVYFSIGSMQSMVSCGQLELAVLCCSLSRRLRHRHRRPLASLSRHWRPLASLCPRVSHRATPRES